MFDQWWIEAWITHWKMAENGYLEQEVNAKNYKFIDRNMAWPFNIYIHTKPKKYRKAISSNTIITHQQAGNVFTICRSNGCSTLHITYYSWSWLEYKTSVNSLLRQYGLHQNTFYSSIPHWNCDIMEQNRPANRKAQYIQAMFKLSSQNAEIWHLNFR